MITVGKFFPDCTHWPEKKNHNSCAFYKYRYIVSNGEMKVPVNWCWYKYCTHERYYTLIYYTPVTGHWNPVAYVKISVKDQTTEYIYSYITVSHETLQKKSTYTFTGNTDMQQYLIWIQIVFCNVKKDYHTLTYTYTCIKQKIIFIG